MDYGELYEYLRKEKYAEPLQPLPKHFVREFADFLLDGKKRTADFNEFSEEAIRSKKQLENAVSVFRELILRRKKKILMLVFVASETGIFKRDYGTLLEFEQELFERLVSAVEYADKHLQEVLTGAKSKDKSQHSMIIVTQDVPEFIDFGGNAVGPFQKGMLVNLPIQVAEILVSNGQATAVDAE
jgi:DNA replication initiation complex subunit (GINS family)